MKCPRCNGVRTIEIICTDPQCGDSSWDHACGHGYERCPLCNGIGHMHQLECGHPVECYRQHGAHGSSCAWCCDLISMGATLDLERRRLAQEVAAGEALEEHVRRQDRELATLRAALTHGGPEHCQTYYDGCHCVEAVAAGTMRVELVDVEDPHG